MQKKLLAIAVAGALAPAAAMAQSTVEIYGRANVGVDHWQAKGATVGGGYNGRLRVFDYGSRVGFRVNESLGGGLRAFVVIESGVNIDSGSGNGQSGAANTSTGTWASRDSYAGIGGAWGDIRFGRQSPYYGNGIISQAGSNYINNAVDSIFSLNHVIIGPTGRESNVVSYNSPTMGGFNASVSWGPGASEGSGYTGAAGQKKEQLLAITGRYSGGPLRAQGDWAQRKNVGNVADGEERTGWKVGVGWAYAPGSQISFITGNHENEEAGVSIDQQLNLVNWEHMMGQWQFIAQYMFTSKIDVGGVPGVSELPDSKAKGYTLAVKYFLSKRTGVYLSFSQIRNEQLSAIDFSNAGFSSAAGGALSNTVIGVGADPRVIALGVMHNF